MSWGRRRKDNRPYLKKNIPHPKPIDWDSLNIKLDMMVKGKGYKVGSVLEMYVSNGTLFATVLWEHPISRKIGNTATVPVSQLREVVGAYSNKSQISYDKNGNRYIDDRYIIEIKNADGTITQEKGITPHRTRINLPRLRMKMHREARGE